MSLDVFLSFLDVFDPLHRLEATTFVEATIRSSDSTAPNWSRRNEKEQKETIRNRRRGRRRRRPTSDVQRRHRPPTSDVTSDVDIRRPTSDVDIDVDDVYFKLSLLCQL